MPQPTNQRELEQDITTDLRDRMSYGGYLQLETLLSAQKPLSNPPHHDEMLFIVQHQISELWIKLMIHELRGVVAQLQADEVDPALKMLARVETIQHQLTSQWSVLETLTPSDYLAFRNVLGAASGFQSLQYRMVEFLLGNKNAAMLKVFGHDDAGFAQLSNTLHSPSLYDVFLAWLARRGHAVPAQVLERDVALSHQHCAELVPMYRRIYENTDAYWEEYHLCEQLVDLETNFQLWRFRHMKTVERIIGYRRGTGGSSGVAFLRRALDLTFFPELFEVRSVLGTVQ